LNLDDDEVVTGGGYEFDVSVGLLTNPKFVFLDEADMFRKGEQEDVRHVAERHMLISKM
jgi:hypothetical protein